MKAVAERPVLRLRAERVGCGKRKPSRRGKERYEAYLHSDCGVSFIEWLKTRKDFYD
jgi:hypothetical protein